MLSKAVQLFSNNSRNLYSKTRCVPSLLKKAKEELSPIEFGWMEKTMPYHPEIETDYYNLNSGDSPYATQRVVSVEDRQIKHIVKALRSNSSLN